MISLAAPALVGHTQEIQLPERSAAAPTGSEFSRHVSALDFANRESEIQKQVLAGNIPGFYRRFCPITVTNMVEGAVRKAIIFVAADYLAVGSDEDYFLVPMTAVTAQRIADGLGCVLPTRKLVNDIFAEAAVKLPPRPIPPSPEMITVPVFAEHNAIVRAQRQAERAEHPLGALVAGHKKDIVITARLTNAPGRVAIFGWHQTNSVPIQPLYLGHTDAWADYSHGVRLVLNRMLLDGQPTTVTAVLANPKLAGLISDEGVMQSPRYATNVPPRYPATMRAVLAESQTKVAADTNVTLSVNTRFDEQNWVFSFAPEVRIRLNLPGAIATNQPIQLILYALPNGNTIEQTFGRKLKAGDDWHFNIQHIGAQTRFLRQVRTDRNVAVAYLEAAAKSWPAWRKKHGDDQIPGIIEAVKRKLPKTEIETVLTGHSGGGSFTFGFLNTMTEIPREVVRIAFLDSNYAYSMSNHLAKIVGWLKAVDDSRLCVLAYDDANALLEGKPFVSAENGTWGRSHAMLRDLGGFFAFAQTQLGDLEIQQALAGRVQFLLKANPDRKILHTVQVERNGFIHAMLTGTAAEGKGYEYFGERAYAAWIDPE